MGVLFREEQITLEGITERLVVAIISDIHILTKRNERRLHEAVDGLASHDVDLVFLLGDYVDNATKDITPLEKLSELEPRYGTYAVLGNHDYHMDIMHLKPAIETAEEVHASLEVGGATVLRNESVQVGTPAGTLNILGVDNLTYGADIHKTFSDVDFSYPTILLAHDPNLVIDLEDEHHTDLILCGHTHGFALRSPWDNPIMPYIPTPLGREFDKGWKEYEGRPMYITSGLGDTRRTFRIFNPPEVVLLEMCPPESLI